MHKTLQKQNPDLNSVFYNQVYTAETVLLNL